MKNNHDVAQSTANYFKRKAYKKMMFEVNNVFHVIDNRTSEIDKHRKIVEHLENFNSDNFEQTKAERRIEGIRTSLYQKREDLLQEAPYLHSSLPHLDRSTVGNSIYSDFKNRENLRKTTHENARSRMFREHENMFKERDLDNDGVPDRIDIDDTRNAVQNVADQFLVGNATDKATNASKQEQTSKRKDRGSTKQQNNIAFESDKAFSNLNSEKDLFEGKVKRTEKRLIHERQKKNVDSLLRNPLSSSKVGKRNLAQKVVTAPTKTISKAGASIKESYNEEIKNSNMAGVQLANDIVSPLASKLKFETSSLIAKKVGFDRRAYKLSKLEKKIINADKKAFKLKQHQRKRIRKQATKNARALGSKSFIGRATGFASKSAKQLRTAVTDRLKKWIGATAGKYAISVGALILAVALPVLILFSVIASSGSAVSSAGEQDRIDNLQFDIQFLPQSVLRWREPVLHELQKYGLEAYVDLVLVIIKLESEGLLPDVMQSSESIGLAPNTITDPLYSIEVGVKHIKASHDRMKASNTDLKTMIHSYNYGTGFTDYVAGKGGSWSQPLANEFSDMWAQQLGWSSYGDKYYVEKAMKYLTISGDNVSLDIQAGKLAYPVARGTYISSPFGWRDGFYLQDGTWYPRNFHKGVDFADATGTPIYASADGTVIVSTYYEGYGNCVMLAHGTEVVTLYAHASQLLVREGDQVKAGQVIALMGSTGYSSGPHLHFEVRVNGDYTNPLLWLD